MYPFHLLERALKELREVKDKGQLSADAVYWVEQFIHQFGPVRAFSRDYELSLGEVLAQSYAAWRASVVAKGGADPGESEVRLTRDGELVDGLGIPLVSRKGPV